MISESPLIESETSQLERAAVDVGTNVGPIAGPLSGAKLHLGNSDLAIAPDTTNAALEAQEGGYDGYAAQTIIWGDPTTSADGTVEVVATALLFTPTGSVLSTSIYNLWISNTGTTVWYFAGAIVDGPLPMESALDQIQVILRYRPATQTLAVCVA